MNIIASYDTRVRSSAIYAVEIGSDRLGRSPVVHFCYPDNKSLEVEKLTKQEAEAVVELSNLFLDKYPWVTKSSLTRFARDVSQAMQECSLTGRDWRSLIMREIQG